jgi:hypothetical protein
LTPTEQAAAFGQLCAPGRPVPLPVVADPEGFPVIPRRFGSIEYHDGEVLAIFTNRARLHAKLWAVPGVRQHQMGDQEMRALFPPEALSTRSPGDPGPAAAGPGPRGGLKNGPDSPPFDGRRLPE